MGIGQHITGFITEWSISQTVITSGRMGRHRMVTEVTEYRQYSVIVLPNNNDTSSNECIIVGNVSLDNTGIPSILALGMSHDQLVTGIGEYRLLPHQCRSSKVIIGHWMGIPECHEPGMVTHLLNESPTSRQVSQWVTGRNQYFINDVSYFPGQIDRLGHQPGWES